MLRVTGCYQAVVIVEHAAGSLPLRLSSVISDRITLASLSPVLASGNDTMLRAWKRGGRPHIHLVNTKASRWRMKRFGVTLSRPKPDSYTSTAAVIFVFALILHRKVPRPVKVLNCCFAEAVQHHDGWLATSIGAHFPDDVLRRLGEGRERG